MSKCLEMYLNYSSAIDVTILIDIGVQNRKILLNPQKFEVEHQDKIKRVELSSSPARRAEQEKQKSPSSSAQGTESDKQKLPSPEHQKPFFQDRLSNEAPNLAKQDNA